MFRLVARAYRLLLVVLSMPFLLAELFDPNTGRTQGVGWWAKCRLVIQVIANTRRITSGTNYLEHLALVTRVLSLPKTLDGAVVECGCYKGASTASLSLACALTGRKLVVCDSFQGLPEPTAADQAHVLIQRRERHTYAQGAWCGSLDEVKRNVTRCGAIEVCEFRPGFFEDSLPGFNHDAAFIFLDVDLRASLDTCLRHLWPCLREGGYLFTHEAPHMEIASLFFDEPWWQQQHQCPSPGLVGAGCGIGLSPSRGMFISSIGFTVKNPNALPVKDVPQIG